MGVSTFSGSSGATVTWGKLAGDSYKVPSFLQGGLWVERWTTGGVSIPPHCTATVQTQEAHRGTDGIVSFSGYGLCFHRFYIHASVSCK